MTNDDDERHDESLLPSTTRRGFMECMAWAGAGVLWTLSSGVLSSRTLADVASEMKRSRSGSSGARGLHFVQISDTHIGFDKEANPDPVATTREAIAKINALDRRPDFLLHTGDLTHAQKPGAFDTILSLPEVASQPNKPLHLTAAGLSPRVGPILLVAW